jgi:hypothetical protein
MIQKDYNSIYISTAFESTTNVSVYGNIIVNPTEEYVNKFFEFADIYGNLKSKLDVGFVNVTNNDLHLRS